MIGIIWFDETKGKDRTFDDNAKAAANSLKARFGIETSVILANPEQAKGIESVNGWKVQPEQYIRPHNFQAWGNEE